MTDTPTPVKYVLDRRAYEVARAKAGIGSDSEVARRTGLHKVTLSRVLSGDYPLSEGVRVKLLGLFPDDFDDFVRVTRG